MINVLELKLLKLALEIVELALQLFYVTITARGCVRNQYNKQQKYSEQ